MVVSITNFFKQVVACFKVLPFRLVFKQVAGRPLGVKFGYLNIIMIFHFLLELLVLFEVGGLFVAFIAINHLLK